MRVVAKLKIVEDYLGTNTAMRVFAERGFSPLIFDCDSDDELKELLKDYRIPKRKERYVIWVTASTFYVFDYDGMIDFIAKTELINLNYTLNEIMKELQLGLFTDSIAENYKQQNYIFNAPNNIQDN